LNFFGKLGEERPSIQSYTINLQPFTDQASISGQLVEKLHIKMSTLLESFTVEMRNWIRFSINQRR